MRCLSCCIIISRHLKVSASAWLQFTLISWFPFFLPPVVSFSHSIVMFSFCWSHFLFNKSFLLHYEKRTQVLLHSNPKKGKKVFIKNCGIMSWQHGEQATYHSRTKICSKFWIFFDRGKVTNHAKTLMIHLQFMIFVFLLFMIFLASFLVASRNFYSFRKCWWKFSAFWMIKT